MSTQPEKKYAALDSSGSEGSSSEDEEVSPVPEKTAIKNNVKTKKVIDTHVPLSDESEEEEDSTNDDVTMKESDVKSTTTTTIQSKEHSDADDESEEGSSSEEEEEGQAPTSLTDQVSKKIHNSIIKQTKQKKKEISKTTTKEVKNNNKKQESMTNKKVANDKSKTPVSSKKTKKGTRTGGFVYATPLYKVNKLDQNICKNIDGKKLLPLFIPKEKCPPHVKGPVILLKYRTKVDRKKMLSDKQFILYEFANKTKEMSNYFWKKNTTFTAKEKQYISTLLKKMTNEKYTKYYKIYKELKDKGYSVRNDPMKTKGINKRMQNDINEGDSDSDDDTISSTTSKKTKNTSNKKTKFKKKSSNGTTSKTNDEIVDSEPEDDDNLSIQYNIYLQEKFKIQRTCTKAKELAELKMQQALFELNRSTNQDIFKYTN